MIGAGMARSIPTPPAAGADAAAPEEAPFPDPLPLPIDGTLDLHAFRPGEVGELVPEWIGACEAAGIRALRIVHGKGTGALRRSVHALLSRDPRVASFRRAGEDGGGWGATLVELHPPRR